MITFEYVAKKNTAETVTGKISAQNQDEAIDLINQLGFLPVSVIPERKSQQKINKAKYKKIKTKELYVFSRQLANLLKSGVTIIRGLNIIQEQTENPYFRHVISEIGTNVKNGKSLSESLACHPTVFSSLYITLISAGEESSNLQQMLINVATYLKKQDEILSKVKTALAYPVLMGIVGILTIYFVLTYVLPKMAGLFENIGDALPLPTVILLSISDFLNRWWIGVVVLILFLSILFRQIGQSHKGRSMFSRFVLKLPLFGDVILKTELARFCRTIVLLHQGGVSFLKALQISIPILSNELIKKDLNVCKNDLTSGGSFGAGIKKSKEIPSIVGHLISVGEESGNLDEVLGDIADTYEGETNEKIKVLTTLLEPLMILSVGLIIGFIVFAMLLPIFQIDILAQ